MAAVGSVAVGLSPETPVVDSGTGDVLVPNFFSNNISVIPPLYSVNFRESGLPEGTVWSLQLNGSFQRASTPTITFAEPNGSYLFDMVAAASIGGYSPIPPGGSANVSGGNLTIRVTFEIPMVTTYTVPYVEFGLPLGTEWWVNVTGRTSVSSDNSTLSLSEPNGTYVYSVTTANKTYSPSYPDGNFTINGPFEWQYQVTFTRLAYTVTFNESGLPPAVQWSIEFDGTKGLGTGALPFPGVSNGTYSFFVSAVAGYGSEPSSGTIRVSGRDAIKTIVFTAVPQGPTNSAPKFLHLPQMEGYALLGGILAVIVLAAAIMGLRYRRELVPNESAHPGPDAGAEEPPAPR
jgi:hypothetical protein